MAAVQEAQQATTAYQTALSQIGVQTAVQSLAIWEQLPPGASTTQARTWLNVITKLITLQRKRSKNLGSAYYRYLRALQTGKTVGAGGEPDGATVPISKLQTDFYTQAGVRVPQGAAEGLTDVPEQILVEQIKDLVALEQKAEAAAVQEIRNNLTNTGFQVQVKLIDQIDKALPSEAADRLKKEAHQRAGARQAASSSMYGMNGARGQTWLMQNNDTEVVGWARISTTGTPCGWCAMLISRGAVYKSERGATVDFASGDEYHPNCHCIAIPVFSEDFYEDSPLFDLNRTYSKLWPKVTKGLGGKDALAAWRKYFRTQQQGAAQAAA